MCKKVSFGVALCRYNSTKNNRIELLMIKKRFSYQFFNFVFGRYKANDNKYLRYLFDNMSFSEKVDILGMQFENMWYRIWLNNPAKHFDLADVFEPVGKSQITSAEKYKLFFQKKSKFERNFTFDGGKRLRELIHQSTSAEITWEIPKGGKHEHETPIDCAVREFTEETSIHASKYNIYYDVMPVIDSIREDDVTYQHCYYIATVNDKEITTNINFRNFEQISEVEQVKWVSLAEIEFMQLASDQHKHLIKLFNVIINVFKKKHNNRPKLH